MKLSEVSGSSMKLSQVIGGDKPFRTPREPIKLASSQFQEAPEITNPLVASVKAASEFIPGTQYAMEYYRKGGPFKRGAVGEAMREAEPIEQAKVKGVPSQIAYGLTSAAPIIAGGAQPFMSAAGKVPMLGKLGLARSAMGFGGYEAARHAAGGRLEEVPEAAKGGAIGGALFHGGGKLGATMLGKPLQHLTRQGHRIGTAAGAGAASALMAPEGEKISSGMIGAGFGAKYPQKPMGYKSPATLMKEATNIYREVLRPGQGEIKNIEVRKGENIDKYFELAAKEKLPLKQTADKKIDTTQARETLRNKVQETSEQLNNALKGDTRKQFDLDIIRASAKKKAESRYKNATEKKAATAEIDKYIDNEIETHGKLVDGSTLNSIKQGMWEVGYNQMNPTAKRNARIIGYEAKNAIEKAYPEANIRKINNQNSEYITLQRILEKAQGRVVPKGRIGTYAARMAGMGVGLAAESLIPIPGLETVAGYQIGGKISEHLASPERATRRAGKRVERARKLGERTYPLDEFARSISDKIPVERAQEIFSDSNLREYILGEIAKGNVAEAEIVEPSRLTFKRRITHPSRLLPGKGEAGQSSGPTIYAEAQPKLPAPFNKPELQTPDVITAESPYKKLPFRSPEQGAKVFGKGFTAEIGPQKKWAFGKKVAKGVLGGLSAAASGLSAKDASAEPPSDEDAIKAILGEVGPYGKEGMQWVASGIRNRNNKLQGIYGHKNPNVVNKKYTKQQYEDAKAAWEESKNKKFTDAKFWFSDADLKQDKVQNIIKGENLELIKKVGGNSFYRKRK